MSATRRPRARLARLGARALPALALLVLCAASAFAGQAVNAPGPDKVAIKGFDPVAYFTDGKPVAGSKEFAFQWMDATWRFASAQHREAFAADPARYAPQYGGYCAYAVSQGGTADIDPAAWTIVGGKLYLNLSKSVQARWSKDIPGHIKAADANWPKIKARLEK